MPGWGGGEFQPILISESQCNMLFINYFVAHLGSMIVTPFSSMEHKRQSAIFEPDSFVFATVTKYSNFPTVAKKLPWKFYLKMTFFKIVIKLLGYFCKKICCLNFSKIAQSYSYEIFLKQSKSFYSQNISKIAQSDSCQIVTSLSIGRCSISSFQQILCSLVKSEKNCFDNFI